jgi:hypothetical protein
MLVTFLMLLQIVCYTVMYIIFLQNYSLFSSNNNEEVVHIDLPPKRSLGMKINEEEKENDLLNDTNYHIFMEDKFT